MVEPAATPPRKIQAARDARVVSRERACRRMVIKAPKAQTSAASATSKRSCCSMMQVKKRMGRRPPCLPAAGLRDVGFGPSKAVEAFSARLETNTKGSGFHRRKALENRVRLADCHSH